MKNSVLLGAALLMAASPAWAEDDCTDAKDFAKLSKAFNAPDAERVDVLVPSFTMAIKGINGAPDPEAMIYRLNGEVTTFPIGEDRLVQGLEGIVFDPDGELCRIVDGQVAQETGTDETVQANMDFTFTYLQTEGDISMDKIEEGAKDGSKIMKSMAPGGLGFVVPGLKMIFVLPPEGASEDAPVPQLTLLRNGQPITAPEPLKGTRAHYFYIKDLKKTKADTLRLDGPYRLSATFKIDREAFEELRLEREAAAAAESTAEAAP